MGGIITIHKRSILGKLGLALAYTPIILIVGLLLIILIGALDDAITKIQLAGNWWVLLIAAYILSLAYIFFEPKIRLNCERDKVVNGLILYWKDQLEKQNKPQPSNREIKVMREMLLERVKIWAWFNPELWSEHFPGENCSPYLFGIVDNFMEMTNG